MNRFSSFIIQRCNNIVSIKSTIKKRNLLIISRLFSNNNNNNISIKTKKIKKTNISLMTIDTAKIELKLLNDEINYHDKLYYSNDSQIIKDSAYDKLVKRAEDIEGKFINLKGIIDKFNRIGSGNRNKKFNSFYHTQSMLSLNNAFNDNDITNFIIKIEKLLSKSIIKDDINYIIEPKIDGLSLSLHYKNGKLIQAGTRGDGMIGEDVTENINYMTNIPTLLPTTQNGNIEIRGELYISKQDFIEINKQRKLLGLVEFSTARNAAAGSIRNLDKNISWLEKKLKFYAYNVIFPLEYNNNDNSNNNSSSSNIDSNINNIITGCAITSQLEVLQYLTKIGFDIAQPYKICNNSIDIIKSCNELSNQRIKLDFDIDGAVIKVKELKYQYLLGNSSRYPKWAIAKKFEAEEGITTLEDIILQVGRTGLITPVAVLNPIKIDGVKIEKATLHNFHEVQRLGII
jgi:DNA ligase (NAD+)